MSSFAPSDVTVLWRSELAFNPYVDGGEAVQFSLLLPEGRIVELFRDQGTGLEPDFFYVVQLLTASKTFGPLKALLAEGLLTWERRSMCLYMYICACLYFCMDLCLLVRER